MSIRIKICAISNVKADGSGSGDMCGFEVREGLGVGRI